MDGPQLNLKLLQTETPIHITSEMLVFEPPVYSFYLHIRSAMIGGGDLPMFIGFWFYAQSGFLSAGHPNSSNNANTTPLLQPKPVCRRKHIYVSRKISRFPILVCLHFPSS